MPYHADDTIAAIATAAGGSARGMIRLSGPNSIGIAAACFVADDGQPLNPLRRATALRGQVHVVLGDATPRHVPCQALVWPTARSYTRERVVEFHTLGSRPLLESLLAALCQAGARLAEPGEFTLRAFLAGRLDLTQAEAVLGVIDARSEDQLHAALAQLAGGLAQPLAHLREQLLQLLAELEAGLDFGDEDIRFISPNELRQRLLSADQLLSDVADQMTARLDARHLDQVVLLGEPNVGKSSLFNALVAKDTTDCGPPRPLQPSAIVSHKPGTTRDYLTARIELDGLRCELVDTAGIAASNWGGTSSDRGGANRPISETASGGWGRAQRAPSDVDAAAQARSAERRAQAAVRVLCVEASTVRGDGPPISAALDSSCDVVVLTKLDLVDEPSQLFDQPQIGIPVVITSSLTGQGLDQLRSVLRELLTAEASAARGHIVASTADRCRESVRLARAAVERAANVAIEVGDEELVAVELRDALRELGKVVGAVYTDDLLDRVFSTFCIGK